MFNGTEGTVITLAQAKQMTKDWRDLEPGTTKAVFFGKDKIQDILNQPNCMGIRVYFAKKSAASNENTIVLVGAYADEKDMESGIIVDHGSKCPSICANGALDK